MKHLIAIALVLVWLPAQASMTSWEAQKDHQITNIVKRLKSLQSVARKVREIPKDNISKTIAEIIPATLPSEELWKLGTMAGLLYHPGDASHVTYDEVFFQAERRCAVLLSQRSDPLSRYYLSLMKSQFGLDGEGLLFYRELINKQRNIITTEGPANKRLE